MFFRLDRISSSAHILKQSSSKLKLLTSTLNRMLLSTALEGGSKIKQRDQERTLLQEVPERGMEHPVVMVKMSVEEKKWVPCMSQYFLVREVGRELEGLLAAGEGDVFV